MPMHVEDLNAQAESGFTIGPETQKAAVLRVLVTNPETAFTPKEIASRAGIPADNAPTVCRRLAEMGAAHTENGYYHLPQDEETAAAVRRALGAAHQEAMAQRTAQADRNALADETTATESESLTDAEIDAKLLRMASESADR